MAADKDDDMVTDAVTVSQQPVALIVAGIAALGAIISPILMAWLTNRNARQLTQDDYARQDEVAARLEKKQQEAEDRQNEVAARLEKKQEESAERQDTIAAQQLVSINRQAEVGKAQTARLDQIHTLVNSSLTAALEDQLQAREANLVLLLEAVAARKLVHQEPLSETLAVIAATRIKVEELQRTLVQRKEQTALAASQLAVDLAKPAEPAKPVAPEPAAAPAVHHPVPPQVPKPADPLTDAKTAAPGETIALIVKV